jgi:hypothetical protein
MKATLVAFVIGLIAGTVVVQAAGRFVLLMRSPDTAKAELRGLTPDELDEEQFRKAEWPLFGLSLIAGVACAIICAARTTHAPALARTDPSRTEAHLTLTGEEFDRAYQCSSWVRLRTNGADFVRGFLVGALARSDPALAAKIEGLGQTATAELRRRLINRQEQMG